MSDVYVCLTCLSYMSALSVAGEPAERGAGAAARDADLAGHPAHPQPAHAPPRHQAAQHPPHARRQVPATTRLECLL